MVKRVLEFRCELWHARLSPSSDISFEDAQARQLIKFHLSIGVSWTAMCVCVCVFAVPHLSSSSHGVKIEGKSEYERQR